MKSTRLQLIEEEELNLLYKERELNQLKERWFKLPSCNRKIETFERYIKLKKEFIERLKK